MVDIPLYLISHHGFFFVGRLHAVALGRKGRDRGTGLRPTIALRGRPVPTFAKVAQNHERSPSRRRDLPRPGKVLEDRADQDEEFAPRLRQSVITYHSRELNHTRI